MERRYIIIAKKKKKGKRKYQFDDKFYFSLNKHMYHNFRLDVQKQVKPDCRPQFPIFQNEDITKRLISFDTMKIAFLFFILFI